jgi:LuxR family maltose regulon positive regulatory protein
MGELSYERNDLTAARQHVRHGLELAQLGGDVRSLIAGHLLGARMHLAEGDPDGAAGELKQAHTLLEQAQFPEWQSRCHRCQLELALAQGSARDIARWTGAPPIAAGDDVTDEPLLDRLTWARALTMTGRPPERQQARQILRDVIAHAAAHSRKGIEIEALALDALARWADGDRAGALVALHRALNLAEPEGFMRLFADLGPPMARLLQEAHHRQTLSTYGMTLLAACVAPDVPRSAPREPLSAREAEVLRLLAAGLTNREIADTLFISAETVKKHTGRIYAKLAASRRTQAVARARELGLLNPTA